jgi:hypothetical protein
MTLTAIVVPLSFVLAYRAQRPFRGPVFIDLGAFPGPVANSTSIAVAMVVYAVPTSILLFGAARRAPRWAFHAARVVAAVGGFILFLVVG